MAGAASGRVLVADDELSVRMLVADVLDEAGLEVIEAPGAEAASTLPRG